MESIRKIPLESILFLDIETVPLAANYSDLDEDGQYLWDLKSKFLIRDKDLTPSDVYEKAGIYAEFGKIVCISVGFLKRNTEGVYIYRTKSFADHDETKLLQGFTHLLNTHFNGDHHLLCAHNGKEFDFPFIARRLLINSLRLPKLLDIAGKKPWGIKHLDTMELWKFGDYKSYTSIKLLTHVFDIPTPKDDIDGSQVARVYYEENDLNRIAVYCQKDTITVAQLLMRYLGMPLIRSEHIIES